MGSEKQATCRKCGQNIIWANIIKKDGHPGKMPFDPDPTVDGTHQLFRKIINGETIVRAEFVVGRERGDVITLRKSHFKSCPKGNE